MAFTISVKEKNDTHTQTHTYPRILFTVTAPDMDTCSRNHPYTRRVSSYIHRTAGYNLFVDREVIHDSPLHSARVRLKRSG